ncbi:hypothetical protein SAMN04489760_11747 [Syntrophus gentianae]|uniref:Uncharacterized protein n=1 Tax=Syntrophus gentianae TaxID=43775 RepID=A0A1H7YNJ6_9BACT|nr:hypothetical protein [Syntrophus gentianae]SEM47802.1 hypothetical protein SAMN04489760_11747 [Syntrophus gentianae]
MHPIGYIIMAFGAFLSVTGIILLSRKGSQGKSVVKMFGFEFELSESSLVIFVFGCLIFLTPLILVDKLPPKIVVNPVKAPPVQIQKPALPPEPQTNREAKLPTMKIKAPPVQIQKPALPPEPQTNRDVKLPTMKIKAPPVQIQKPALPPEPQTMSIKELCKNWNGIGPPPNLFCYGKRFLPGVGVAPEGYTWCILDKKFNNPPNVQGYCFSKEESGLCHCAKVPPGFPQPSMEWFGQVYEGK